MKISLQRISTKDLVTLAQRVIQISKNEKHQVQLPFAENQKKTLRAYWDFVNIMKVHKDWEGGYQEVNEIVKVARNSK